MCGKAMIALILMIVCFWHHWYLNNRDNDSNFMAEKRITVMAEPALMVCLRSLESLLSMLVHALSQ